MKKTAEFIEEAKEARRAERKAKRGRKPRAGDNTESAAIARKRSLANLRPPWKPGESGNPGGRPKHDVAKEIAQAVIEGNKEAAYIAFTKALLKGNAYVFKELSDRAYGKVKETIEHQGTLGIIEVKARVAELLQKRDADRS